MSRQYWSGKVINKLEENEVFVFGSNPVLSSNQICPFFVQNE